MEWTEIRASHDGLRQPNEDNWHSIGKCHGGKQHGRGGDEGGTEGGREGGTDGRKQKEKTNTRRMTYLSR